MAPKRSARWHVPPCLPLLSRLRRVAGEYALRQMGARTHVSAALKQGQRSNERRTALGFSYHHPLIALPSPISPVAMRFSAIPLPLLCSALPCFSLLGYCQLTNSTLCWLMCSSRQPSISLPSTVVLSPSLVISVQCTFLSATSTTSFIHCTFRSPQLPFSRLRGTGIGAGTSWQPTTSPPWCTLSCRPPAVPPCSSSATHRHVPAAGFSSWLVLC